jgi:hypothetical protein
MPLRQEKMEIYYRSVKKEKKNVSTVYYFCPIIILDESDSF